MTASLWLADWRRGGDHGRIADFVGCRPHVSISAGAEPWIAYSDCGWKTFTMERVGDPTSRRVLRGRLVEVRPQRDP